MSNGNSNKPRRRGHLLRMLARLGFLSPGAVEEIRKVQQTAPLEKTANIVLNKGLATPQEIETAEHTASGDIPAYRPNGECDPTTGEILANNFQETQQTISDTVTQSMQLSDIADQISLKKKKG